MPSVFGQMAETGASGASGAGGGVGSILGSLGSSIGSLFSGGGFGTSAPPGLPTVDNPDLGVSMPAGTPPGTLPAYASALPSLAAAGDPSAALGAVASPSDASMAPAGPASALNPPVSVATGAAPGSAITSSTPEPAQTPDPTLWQEIKNFFEGGGGPGAQTAPGSAGAGSKGMGLSGWIGLGGGLMEMLNRYLVQRTLQDPAKLGAAANKLARPLGAQARERLIAPARAAAMETSGVNAPLLYSQAIASVLAPYQYQAEQNALREEIAALTASESGAFGGPSMFGGGGSATG